MKKIPLTKGQVAIVDDADFEWLMSYSWHATKGTTYNGFCARTNVWAGAYKQRSVLMHRLILQAPAHLYVDHINFDTLDNRRCNLRLCDVFQSAGHKRKFSVQRPYKGVSRWGFKFKAVLSHAGKDHYLGLFRTAEAAAQAYDGKARSLYGQFAHPNV